MDYNIDTNEYDIPLIRGTNEIIRFWGWEMVDEVGDIVPWSLEGKAVFVHFKTDLNNILPDLELTIANGGLKVEPTLVEMYFGQNTLNLKNDIYYYDVLIIDNGIRMTMVRGKLILTGIVTR